jgi:hypothetical protein
MSPIPWAAILRHAPALVASARSLLASSGVENLRHQNASSEARIVQLENASIESARLLQEMAEQIHALAIAQERTARRARIAIAVGVVAAVLGIAAGMVAMVR